MHRSQLILNTLVALVLCSATAAAAFERNIPIAQLDNIGQINLSVDEFEIIESPQRLTQTLIDKPAIATVVVLNAYQVGLLAKEPGTALLGVRNPSDLVAVRVVVSQPKTKGDGKNEAVSKPSYLLNDGKDLNIQLERGQWCELDGAERFSEHPKPIVVDNPDIAQAQFSDAPSKIALLAKQAGATGLHLTSEDGSQKDFRLQVTDASAPIASRPKLNARDRAVIYRQMSSYITDLNLKKPRSPLPEMSKQALEKARQLENPNK